MIRIMYIVALLSSTINTLTDNDRMVFRVLKTVVMYGLPLSVVHHCGCIGFVDYTLFLVVVLRCILHISLAGHT